MSGCGMHNRPKFPMTNHCDVWSSEQLNNVVVILVYRSFILYPRPEIIYFNPRHFLLKLSHNPKDGHIRYNLFICTCGYNNPLK